MLQGIVLVISACFVWGLIYIVPQYMDAFNSLEVALGRYFFYGLVSCMFMVCFRWKQLTSFPRKIWKMAFLFGLLTNIGFYPLAVLCMRCADSAIAALILGMSPVTIAFYGNWKEKECSFKSLIGPSLAMTLGLAIVNVPPIQESITEGTLGMHLLGLFFGFGALASWSLYAVLNGHLLKHNPSLQAGDWCCIVGIATFAWVLLAGSLFAFFQPVAHLEKFFHWTPELKNFLLGSAVLGLFCSWIGFFLWNKGSSRLPISLAGELTIFETLFGLLFIYLNEQRFPSSIEFIGVFFMLGGIYLGVKNFGEQPVQVRENA